METLVVNQPTMNTNNKVLILSLILATSSVVAPIYAVASAKTISTESLAKAYISVQGSITAQIQTLQTDKAKCATTLKFTSPLLVQCQNDALQISQLQEQLQNLKTTNALMQMALQ